MVKKPMNKSFKEIEYDLVLNALEQLKNADSFDLAVECYECLAYRIRSYGRSVISSFEIRKGE